MDDIDVLYQDDHLVAVNKPHGLLVHPSPIARNANQFALHMVRDIVGKFVYPAHRLDRKTSGVLLFALDKAVAKRVGEEFNANRVHKIYHAIVRGFFHPDEFELDYDLTNDRGKVQKASTKFNLLKKTEIDLAFGEYLTSRYSLIECIPKSGRMHQIRKHLAHLRYPIIGDRPHGCNKQNKLFKQKWGMDKMLLNAISLEINHPISDEKIKISAKYSDIFQQILITLQFL